VSIEFDPDKDAINRRKHGLSLADAELMDLAEARSVPDTRYAYAEDRYQAYGMIGKRLHVLVYTMRGTTVRAISLRKANPREVNLHGQKA
jgi:hypothetical protein